MARLSSGLRTSKMKITFPTLLFLISVLCFFYWHADGHMWAFDIFVWINAIMYTLALITTISFGPQEWRDVAAQMGNSPRFFTIFTWVFSIYSWYVMVRTAHIGLAAYFASCAVFNLVIYLRSTRLYRSKSA